MATYPTLPTKYGSDFGPATSLVIDRAEDGTGRARRFGADKGKASVVHPWLDAADKAVLDAFYSANRLLPFDYTSPADSISRSCLFAGPIAWKREYGSRWTATVGIEEV